MIWSFDSTYFSEQNIISGFIEAVDRHFGPKSQCSIVGHSFGTTTISQILRHVPQSRIGQLTLIDPIAMFLSDGHVLKHFLYERPLMKESSIFFSFSRFAIIGYDASICYYFQRGFFWYNSELFLDNIPSSSLSSKEKVHTVLCISSHDELLNAPLLKEEADAHQQKLQKQQQMMTTNGGGSFDILWWNGANHGKCIVHETYWNDIMNAISKQEQLIYKEKNL